MTFPRFKKKTTQNKNKHTLKRLVRCSERHLNSAYCDTESGTPKDNDKQAVQLTQKDISNILIDISMKELYNQGDKRELRLVEDILTPNKIKFSNEQSLESYWDIITNSGFVKPSIGFGNNGKVSLSKAGFDLMNQFGSYMDFLRAQEPPRAGSIPNPQLQPPSNTPPKDAGKDQPEEDGDYYDQ